MPQQRERQAGSRARRARDEGSPKEEAGKVRDRLLRVRDLAPVHGWFELSYASYLVLQRSLMEAMPVRWQLRFVRLMDEVKLEFDTRKIHSDFRVIAMDGNRFVQDPLRFYRHVDRELIDSVRRKRGVAVEPHP
jgi:hypothetical protein